MKRYSSNKDWNAVINRLVKLGWRYRRGGKHGQLTHPDSSEILVVPISPSDRRSLQNFMQLLRSTGIGARTQ
ncbi:type II toxin-antitoxin system HicA family toxin [Marinobacter sp. F4216]|uniref:type II toxin-antitoxin system HicA family toxin n=1 Tax=Marinobacter sp. F4216 TaxID=2874281 RepID=UPI001CBF4240|nr:type II toxin-antitoxin system HicA family toxin [Marinobacter sp. F4216]